MTLLIGKIKNTKIEVELIYIFIPILYYFLGLFLEYGIVFFSMVLHELGHIAIAMILKKRIFCIRILPIGLNAEIEFEKNKYKSILINLAGPFINLALIFFANSRLMLPSNSNLIEKLNIGLLVFNLIPILPLDGGNILRLVLELFIKKSDALIWSRGISNGFVVLLLGLVFFQSMFFQINISLILVSIYLAVFNKNRQNIENILEKYRL